MSIYMSMTGEQVYNNFIFESHCKTDPISISLPAFYTLHYNIMWRNPSTKVSHTIHFHFFKIYEKHFMHDVISAASFNIVETLQSWHSHISLIFCNSFHIVIINLGSNDKKCTRCPPSRLTVWSEGPQKKFIKIDNL